MYFSFPFNHDALQEARAGTSKTKCILRAEKGDMTFRMSSSNRKQRETIYMMPGAGRVPYFLSSRKELEEANT